MKKFTAAFLACILIAAMLSFTGCSAKKKSKVTADDVYGTWDISDPGGTGLSGGYFFDENGSVSIYSDISKDIHFDGNEFVFGDQRISSDNIGFEGNTLKIRDGGLAVLSLECVDDEPNPVSYNGKYRVGNCIWGKMLASSITGDSSVMPVMFLSFLEDSTIIMVANVMKYSVDNGEIEFSNFVGGSSVISDMSGKLSLSGDTLTIEMKNGNKRTLVRKETY